MPGVSVLPQGVKTSAKVGSGQRQAFDLELVRLAVEFVGALGFPGRLRGLLSLLRVLELHLGREVQQLVPFRGERVFGDALILFDLLLELSGGLPGLPFRVASRVGVLVAGA